MISLLHFRKWISKHIIGWIAVYLISFSTYSQSTDLKNYSLKEGLPGIETYDVFQDSRGFIWFATDHGVARFDGYDMKTYTVKDGLSDPVVFSFAEDSDQRIWFRTYSGKLSYYKNDSIYHYINNDKLEELIKNNLLYCLIPQKDSILFSTETAIGSIETNGTINTTPVNIHEVSIQTLSNNNLLYGMNGISTFIKKVKINRNHYPISLTDSVVHNKVTKAIYFNNDILFSINSDIFKFDGNTVSKIFTGRSSIINLSKDAEGNLWVGYLNKGVDKLNAKFQIIDTQNLQLLSDKSVTKVFQDHEKGIWFSTLENGVYYASNLKTKIINHNEKIRYATFNSNFCIIGDQEGFVSVYNLKNTSLVWKKNFNEPVRCLFVDRDEHLWVSSNHTYICDINSGHTLKEVSGSYTHFSYENDSTLIASGGIRIVRFDLKGDQKKVLLTTTMNLKALSVNSKILITDRLGLYINDSSLKLIYKPEALTNSKISQLKRINNNQIFVGTIGNGFHLIDNHFNINSFNSKQHLIATDVYDSQIKDSILWIATEKGLIELKINSPKDNQVKLIRNIYESPTDKINFFNFTSKGLWLISDYTIRVIESEQNIQNLKPIFYFEWTKPVNSLSHQSIEIPYNTPLQLVYGYISFKNQNIYTRYRVSLEDDWIETPSRIIDLPSISSGNYELEIEYSFDRLKWVSAYKTSFQVHPPWWNTWYFRISVLIAFLSFGYIVFKYRLNRLEEKNTYLNVINQQQKKLLQAEIEATERERSRIAKDLHDGISIDLMAIKLLTQMNNANGSPEIEEQVEKTSAEIKNIIYGLNPPGLERFGLSVGLKHYLDRITSKSTVPIHYSYYGDEFKNTTESLIIFRIIQELISNSFKHSKCKNITIQLKSFITSLQISYVDDGIGFNQDTAPTGLGLSNILSRIESLNGTISFNSSPTGTSYSIIIPIHNKEGE